jgi:hypothetical protein
MRKEHIGGIVVLGIVALVIYYFWKQPAGAAGIALRNAWQSVQSAVSNNGGGSRSVAAMPDASTMSTTPIYNATVPVAYGGPLPGNVGDDASRATLVSILQAPVGTVQQGGGNNGDVIANRLFLAGLN